ncbi:MAG: glycosyltransferase family 39 protein [Candidatus Omnitrophota bacterium]
MKYPRIKLTKNIIFICFILLVALILRLYRLGANDLWNDEVYSVFIANDFWGSWNPPLYFAGLHYWVKVFGLSEFSLRLPSAIFGAGSVLLLFMFGKRLFDEKIGLIASLMLCLSSFNIWYSQEARPYTLQVFFSILSTYILYRAITERKKLLWIYFSLVSILALYSNINYFHFFLLVTQLFLAVFFLGKKMRVGILSFAAALVLFLPFLFNLISKAYCIKNGFWIPVPSAKSLLVTVGNFNLGYNSNYASYMFSNILCLFFLIASIYNIKRRDQVKNFIAAASLFILPILLVFFISKLWVPVYVDRGLIIFSPYYYIILALGLDFIGKKFSNIIIILFLVILMSFPLTAYYTNYLNMPWTYHMGAHLKKPFKPAVSLIDLNSREGDFVVHTNPSSPVVFTFYSKKNSLKQNFIFAPGMIDSSWNRPYTTSERAFCVSDIGNLNFSRLWIIASSWSRNGILDDNSREVKDWLDKNFKLDFSEEFDGLWVFRYVKK